MKLFEWTAGEAQQAIKRKELKARELAETAISRMEATDDRVKAFITLTGETALQQADDLDRHNQDNGKAPPLAGVPVAVKDNLALEGYPCTLGAKAFQNMVSPYTAAVVSRIIDAGGLIMGKTNLDEFGLGSFTHSSHFCVTRNPLDLERVAGDGAAAAVACGHSLLGIASDTGGAVREAAAYCGIAGLRPTPGLVSRHGLAAFSSSLSQVGLLSRKAGDLALLLETIAGFDPRDSSTMGCPHDLENELPGDGAVKIGFPTHLFDQVDGSLQKVVEDKRNHFAEAGLELKNISLPHFAAGLLAYYILVMAESFSNLSRYDGIRYGESVSGNNLEEWYQKNRGLVMGEEAKRRSLMGAYLLNEDNFEEYYRKAQKVWTLVKRDFQQVLPECHLLMLPVTRSPAPPVKKGNNFLDDYRVDEFCAPVSLAGLPSLSLPLGLAEGLPVNIQLVGRPFMEKGLLALGERLEEIAGFSAAPVL